MFSEVPECYLLFDRVTSYGLTIVARTIDGDPCDQPLHWPSQLKLKFSSKRGVEEILSLNVDQTETAWPGDFLVYNGGSLEEGIYKDIHEICPTMHYEVNTDLFQMAQRTDTLIKPGSSVELLGVNDNKLDVVKIG